MKRIERCFSTAPSVPVARLVDTVIEAERLGFSKVYVADQGMKFHDIFMAMAVMAMRTNKIRIGPGITNPFIRHPGITAAAMVTLAEISGDRAFLGISSGGSNPLNPLCIVPDKPMTAVREMIVTCRALFRGEAVTFQGETLKYKSAKLISSKPGIEIYVVGRGPNMLKMAGELADGVMLGNIHKSLMQKSLDLIRAGAAISGNKPKICYFTPVITDEETFEEERAHIAYNIVDSPPEAKELLGITPGEVENIRQVLNTSGMAKVGKLIKKEWMDPFVIMGSPAECKKELTDMLSKYQIDEFQSRISWAKSPLEQMERVLEIVPDQVP